MRSSQPTHSVVALGQPEVSSTSRTKSFSAHSCFLCLASLHFAGLAELWRRRASKARLLRLRQRAVKVRWESPLTLDRVCVRARALFSDLLPLSRHQSRHTENRRTSQGPLANEAEFCMSMHLPSPPPTLHTHTQHHQQTLFAAILVLSESLGRELRHTHSPFTDSVKTSHKNGKVSHPSHTVERVVWAGQKQGSTAR